MWPLSGGYRGLARFVLVSYLLGACAVVKLPKAAYLYVKNNGYR